MEEIIVNYELKFEAHRIGDLKLVFMSKMGENFYDIRYSIKAVPFELTEFPAAEEGTVIDVDKLVKFGLHIISKIKTFLNKKLENGAVIIPQNITMPFNSEWSEDEIDEKIEDYFKGDGKHWEYVFNKDFKVKWDPSREKEKLFFTYSLFVYLKEYKVPEVGYSFIHERCTSLQDKVADRLMEKLDKIKYKIDYNKLEQSHVITRVNSGFTEEGIEDCLENMIKDIPLRS